MFDVGALIFKIQTAGAQVFQRDMAQADQAIKKVEGSAKSAKPALEAQGKATETLGQQIKRLEKELDAQGRASETAKQKLARLKQEQAEQVQVAKNLSLALIAGGLAVSAMVGLSVAKFAVFDEAMSNTAAATMATADEQERLGDAALKAGADTAYSAKEAAAAEEELAKAGQTVSDIVGGSLTASLSLAAAGQLAVARSAEIMATTLKQYKLPAEQAAHVSDVLAAGAGKAQGSVDDMALALSYVGPVAAGLKISLEETAGTIAYLASQGILGEKAGTGLRGVLMSLTAPSAIATRTMKEYGIEIFDSSGNMKSLSSIADILHQKLGGLTEAERSAALGRIFGNEQITSARVLYSQGGKAIDEWTDKVNDSGYAAEQAAKRQDNLAGDVEKLGGAFDTALIKTGSGANDVLREMAQSVTALIDGYGELPQGVQTTALIFGVLTGAILLTSGAALGLSARFTELRAQLERNNISMGKTAAIGGAVGLALAGIVTVVAILAQKQAEARAKAEAYADTLEEGTNRVTDATRRMVVENLTATRSMLWWNDPSAADRAEDLGLSLDMVADAALGDADALKELQGKLQEIDGAHRSSQDEAEKYDSWIRTVTEAVAGETGSIEEAIRVAEQKQRADKESVETSQSAADAYLDAAGGAEELNTQIEKLIESINEANGIGQDAVSTNARWQDSLAGISEEVQQQKDDYESLNGTVDGFTLSLDQATASGSANASMLADVAGAAQGAAEAQYDVDLKTMSAKDATDKYSQTLSEQRTKFEESAVAAGFNADEVHALADQVFALPDEKAISILADTAAASQKITDLVRTYDGKTITLKLRANDVVVGGKVYGGLRGFGEADGGVVRYYANGGTEHHVAQIARAGEYRVWAEPETGGESYIPLAPAKRGRSEQIMAETAQILGGVYIPSGASAFAGGGVSGGRSSDGPQRIAREDLDYLIRGIAQKVRVDERMGWVK